MLPPIPTPTQLGLGSAASHDAGDFVGRTGDQSIAGGLTVYGLTVNATAASCSVPATFSQNITLDANPNIWFSATGGGGGLFWTTGDNQWFLYQNASDPNLYVRDATHGRMHVTHAPAATSDAALTQFNAYVTAAAFVGTGDQLAVDADGPTVTFNLSLRQDHLTVLLGNRTLALANEPATGRFTVMLRQGGAGSWSVTWWAGITWAAGTPPALSTTAGKTDIFVFYKAGTGVYYGFVPGQNL